MKPTDLDDIEQLLQQYGSDLRQQESAKGRIRREARRSKILVLSLVGCLILLGVGVGLYSNRSFEQPAQPPLLAQNTVAPKTVSSESVIEKNTPRTSRTFEAVLPQLLDPDSVSTFAPQSETPQDTEVLDVPPSPIVNTSLQEISLLAQNDLQYTPVVETEAEMLSENTPRRFRFSAAVGASVTGSVSMPLYGGLGASGALASTDVVEPTTYSNTNFQANAGVDMMLASGRKLDFSVGLGVTGMVLNNRTEVHTYYAGQSLNRDPVNNTPVETVTNTQFQCYLGLPLTVGLYPRGHDRLGWLLSATPARLVEFSDPLWGRYNVWKLTLGIGAAIPHSPVRSVLFTANLLPISYFGQYSRIHEFGISIGF